MTDGPGFDASAPHQQPRFPWGGRPRTQPDPGRPPLAWLWTCAAVLFIGLVAFIQQTAPSAATRAAGQPPLAPGSVTPPGVQISFFAKAGVKLWAVLDDPNASEQTRTKLAKDIVGSVSDQATDPQDRVRAAIVAGELLGPASAVEHLEDIPGDALANNAALSEDVETLRTIYRNQDPEPAKLDALIDRHGWFGRLASVHGSPKNDAERQAVVGGGHALAVGLLCFAVLVCVAMIAGFVLLVIGIVKAASGTLPSRFTPPMPGGSAPIEAVAIFVLGFIGLKIATDLVDKAAGAHTALYFAIGAQWLLALLIFWPILRGVPRDQWLYLVGLHRGRGVLREIGAGFLGYLAVLPILLMGVAATFTIMVIKEAMARSRTGGKPEPLHNPVLDLVGGAHGPVFVILFFLLASLWAPLVEEAIFRGALYRHLRGYMHWIFAGVFTALGFGLMHGYPILLLGPVISLGFGFALLREWRGSIIACMTAHCIHNASIVLLLLTIFRLAGM